VGSVRRAGVAVRRYLGACGAIVERGAALGKASVTIFDELADDSPHSMRRVLGHFRDELAAAGVPHEVVRPGWPIPFDRTRAAHLAIAALYRLIVYPLAARRRLAADSVHLLMSGGLAQLLWLTPRDRRVVMVCHDVFAFLDDATLGHRLDFGGRVRRAVLRALQRRPLRRASLVVAPSESTRRDVMREAGVAAERVTVAPWRVDPALFRPGDRSAARRELGLAERDRVIFAVTSPERRKNLERLFEAVGRLREGGGRDALRLVLVGRLSRAQRRALRRAGLDAAARVLVDVDDRTMAACYRAADCCAFVSLYEGFGFPAAEAMACGCPLVCSDRAAVPEVVGEVGRYVDAFSARSIAHGLDEVLRDEGLRRRMRDAGLARARRYQAQGRLVEALRPVLDGAANPAAREARGW